MGWHHMEKNGVTRMGENCIDDVSVNVISVVVGKVVEKGQEGM